MALYFENLDDRTRQLMLDEVEYDIAHNQLHISPFLSGQGQRDYVNLLREAVRSGNDETWQGPGTPAHLKNTAPAQPRSGGYSITATPENAAGTAESEFNRYYIRALRRRRRWHPELVIIALAGCQPAPESARGGDDHSPANLSKTCVSSRR
jgi:hypothetical protein